MAKFLNTSAGNYYLEELIKNASDRLILISPYLRFNDRIKELIEDKNRLKIDVRIIYGKNELQNSEIEWLSTLPFVRTSFCKNLHAKCYINEENCIITSLNLYEFSQVNNNEMGVAISRSEDTELYKDAFDEAQRIIRVSDEVRMSVEKIDKEKAPITENPDNAKPKNNDNGKPITLTATKLAAKLGMKKAKLNNILIKKGYIEIIEGKEVITPKGKLFGKGPIKGRYGEYNVWNEDIDLS